MEVMCMTCGQMFSVDDNDYEGEWENFCSVECQNDWLDKTTSKKPVVPADDEGFKLVIKGAER